MSKSTPSKQPVFPHTVIRASAGTGKTHQLTNRFIALLAAGIPPDQILATTFTRKAAGEIQERVLLRLAEAAGDEAACRALAEAIGDKRLTMSRARKLLVETVRSLHRLRVGTLDSYFLEVAGGFGLELGLPPGWSICDELVEQALREEAIEETLSRGRLSELLTLVNLLAKGEAVRGVGRIVGDTVTQLFGYYRQTEAPAWEQIPLSKGLTTDELEAALASIAEFPMPESRWTKTRDSDVANARLADWTVFISKGLAAKVLCGESAFYNKPIPSELLELYERVLAHAASVLVGRLADQTRATHRLLAHFAEQHAALQTRRRALRFDDVTHRLAAAAGVNARERLAFRMDGLVRHLLLDEFQDTAPVQWQVLRPLAQAIAAQQADSFFCVGDTKQAIYGWRGGEAEIFDCLAGELPGLTEQSLAKSYRSSQPVIDAVNQVFANLSNHPNLDKLHEPVAAWQSRFPEHSTAKGDLPGYVRLEFAPPAGDEADTSDALFEFAAQKVAEHVRDAPQCSVGVLVRTNKAVAKMIYMLRRLQIPASEEGGNPLIDSPAVELILSLLKLADHPGDGVARFHLANSPVAKALELTDHMDNRAAEQLARQTRRRLLEEGYGPVVFDWARRLAEHCDRRDQSRLQQLVELAYEYQPASTLRPGDFVRLVERRKVADPSAADVRVMTIHQAKGLEFDIVVLPELDCKLIGQPDAVVIGRPKATEAIDVVCRYANEDIRRFLPPRLADLFDDDRRRTVAESLCVLYVAMTRPIHCLHMILTPPRANERTVPKTYAGLLRTTLAGGSAAASGVAYERGERKWFAKLAKRPAPAPASEAPPQVALAPPPSLRSRGLERTSPSSLEGGSRISAVKLLDPSLAAAFEHGTLIHAWLAHLHWLDEGWPDEKTLLAAAAKAAPQLAANNKDLKHRLAELRKQLEQPQIAAVLRRSFYDSLAPRGPKELTVQTERAFALRQGDELLSGSIDRLVLIRHGGKLIAADVVDYKTDAIAPGDQRALAEATNFYRPQLAAYRQSVATLFRLDVARVSARLVFLTAGTFKSIE